MGSQIIQQPNGKYAVWCTNSDSFEVRDCTRKGIIKYFMERAAWRAKQDVLDIFAKFDAGQNPYYQFAVPWDEALAWHNKYNVKKEKKKKKKKGKGR